MVATQIMFTATAAEAIGLPDRGVLQAGKRADLIVVEGDPLCLFFRFEACGAALIRGFVGFSAACEAASYLTL